MKTKFNEYSKDYTFEELYNRLPLVYRNALAKCEQDPIWHPEGVVETHVRMVFDYAKTHFPEDKDLLLVALFHDLGKPETQRIKEVDGKIKISNIGHETKCSDYIDKFFDLYADVSTNKEKVKEICNNHMRTHLYIDGKLSKPSKRKAFEELKYFSELIKFAECDKGGR